MQKSVHFPDHYYDLHPNASFNFELNRMYGWVDEQQMLAELREAAPAIRSFDEWRRTFVRLSDAALANGRTLAGAYYLRLAQFYMFADDPVMKPARLRFIDLVLSAYGMSREGRTLIPFGKGALPAYRFTPPSPKGTIVLFGGYDSYIEEWMPMFVFLRDGGQDVIVFEGPGQGGALEEYGLTFTPSWNEPTAAVLDHFGLTDVTLIGVSFGGCLVVRAAAFEPRVRRVVALDACSDLLTCMLRQIAPPGPRLAAFQLLMRAPVLLDAVLQRAMKSNTTVEWGIKQGLHTCGVTSPHALFEAMRGYVTADVSARVTQDVLLLCGAEDIYIPRTQIVDQLRMLTNASSVTAHVFTRADQAQQHCQIGNEALALNYVLDWIAAAIARR